MNDKNKEKITVSIIGGEDYLAKITLAKLIINELSLKEIESKCEFNLPKAEMYFDALFRLTKNNIISLELI